MNAHTAHVVECARRVIATAAAGTIDLDGNPCDSAWDAFDCGDFAIAASDFHTCHVEAALMVVWLLARKQYQNPALFEAETGVILAPVIMGEYL